MKITMRKRRDVLPKIRRSRTYETTPDSRQWVINSTKADGVTTHRRVLLNDPAYEPTPFVMNKGDKAMYDGMTYVMGIFGGGIAAAIIALVVSAVL